MCIRDSHKYSDEDERLAASHRIWMRLDRLAEFNQYDEKRDETKNRVTGDTIDLEYNRSYVRTYTNIRIVRNYRK